jgi:Transposase IS116/IS110/IS902 family
MSVVDGTAGRSTEGTSWRRVVADHSGVRGTVAQVIVAETGADMSRFPSAAHLAAWAGLAPAMHESAGRQTPAGKRHGNKWLTAMLVEAAGSVGRMKKGKNYLAAQHARLTRRRGMRRAQVAVAHSILVSAYWMLKRDEPYRDFGADWHSRRNNEAHARRLIAQLERLGHTVILDPPPNRHLITSAGTPPTLPRPALARGIHGSVTEPRPFCPTSPSDARITIAPTTTSQSNIVTSASKLLLTRGCEQQEAGHCEAPTRNRYAVLGLLFPTWV